MRTRLVAALALLLVGCAAPEPTVSTTVSTQDGVSLPRVRQLKRLLLLPLDYEIDGKVPKSWDPVVENARVQDSVIRYLEDWRDYRVKPAPGLAGAELRLRLLEPLSHAPAAGTWPPQPLRADIQRLALAHGADGVLLLGLRFEGLDAKRWGAVYGIAFFTLGLGELAYVASLGTHYTAAIFDGSDGALVWSARRHGGSSDQPDAALHAGRLAFDTLPNALAQAVIDESK